jgi:hypothetical protein
MKVKPTQEPTETDYMKVAMIIDCEGNIQISGKPGCQYQLKITVAQTNPALPRWCVERFGGYFLPQFYDKKPKNNADAYRWRIQSYPAAELLKKCLDHFIMKRNQAEIAIKFQATFKTPGQRASHSTKLLWEELKQQLLALTGTGPKGPARQPIEFPEENIGQGNLFAN